MHSRSNFAFAVRGLVIAASCLLHVDGVTAMLIIDDFNTGPITLTRTSEPQVTFQQTGLDPNHVIGGSRNITVNGHFSTYNQTMTVDAVAGELQAASHEGTVSIRYGGVNGPLNLNLAARSSQFLRIDVTSHPMGIWGAGNSPFIFFGTPTNRVFYGIAEPDYTPIPGGAMFLIPLFPLHPSQVEGSPNLNSISGIEILFSDAFPTKKLTLVAIVPEPTTVALLTTIVPFAMLRLRRSRQIG